MHSTDELNDNALDGVTGGAGEVMPMATGGIIYRCPACSTVISVSTRDTKVTCPNLKCRCQYQVINGKLQAVSSSL